MDDTEVREYLDNAIRQWRKSNEPFALYYVDAFQSARASLLGETLAPDDDAEDRATT